MLRHQAGRRRGRGRPAGVAHALVLGVDMGEHPFQIRVDERPGAHVLGLFLAPHHLGVAEARQLGDQRLGRERIELLDAQQVDVVDAALLALLVEVVVDLARAQHDAADLGILDQLDRLVRAAAAHRPTTAGGRRSRPTFRRASTPPACGAAATSASSGSAACGSRASAAGAGCGSSWPASCSWRPACCLRRRAAGSARAGPRNAPAPGLHSHAAAGRRGPTCAATCARPTR